MGPCTWERGAPDQSYPEVRGKVMSREGGEGENFGMERWAPGIWGSTMGKGLEYHGVQLPRNGGSKRYAEG